MKEVIAYCRVACAKESDPSAEVQLHSATLDAAGTDPLCAAAAELHFAGVRALHVYRLAKLAADVTL
jgi:hypothetical protein